MDADVLIVGGGPIGVGLAIDLAQRGVTSKIIERYTSIQRIPKGQNMTQRTGEHFRAWGVSQAIRDASPIPPSFGNSGLTAYGSLFSGYHYDWFRRASVREYYAADNERAPQYETERVLRERAAELPGTELLTGWTGLSVDQDDTRVCLTVEQTNGAARQQLTGRYLVGCDGSNSSVRQAAGITETVDSRDTRMALLVFNSSDLDEQLNQFPGKTIFNVLHPDLKGYWQFLGRVDLKANWFFHAPVPANTTRENFDVDAFLTRAIGRPVEAQYEHIGFWDLRFCQADSYRAGRIFIAGDAAHSHPPYGGYGINTGFEDIRNLSWKLAAVLQQGAPDRLLDTYSEERHPVFASTRDDFIAHMIEQDADFTAHFDPAKDLAAFETAWDARANAGDPAVGRFLPHYAGSSIVVGERGARCGAVGVHQHRALAGYHLSPQVLHDGTDVYDLLGAGFSLILIGEGHSKTIAAMAADFTSAAGAMQLPLKVIRTQPTEATDRWQASMILVRPDNFIAYSTDNIEEATGGGDSNGEALARQLLSRCIAVHQHA